MKVTMLETRGEISGPFTHDLVYQLNQCPSRKRWKDGVFCFELTAANLEYLKMQFPAMEWDEAGQSKLSSLKQMRADAELFRQQKRQPVVLDETFPYKSKPFEHQAKAFCLSRDKTNFALLMEMGCGKTKVIIDTAAYLYQQGKIDLMVILAPNGVHRNWVDHELPAHMPEFSRYKAAFYKAGSSKQHKKIREVLAYTEGLKVLAANIDLLSQGDKGVAQVRDWMKAHRALLVIDESTRIKSVSSNRGRGALRLAPYAAYRRIMTGAPVTKGLEDLFMQFRFLDPSILGLTSFVSFRNRYCVTQAVPGGQVGASKIVGYKNVEELQGRIDGHSYRVEKKDCLDLPPKIYLQREVELTPEQRKLYDQLKSQFMVEMGNGAIIDMKSAAVRLIRLQQVVCGYIVDEDQNVHEIASNRPKLVRDLLEEIGERKIIIWSRFTHDIMQIARLCKETGIGHVNYYGAVPDDVRAENVNRFQQESKYQVFNGNAAAGGIGITLTAAEYLLYYSNSFNAEHRWQSEDRAHRIGQRNCLTITDAVARNTIDRRLLHCLKTRSNIAALAFDRGMQWLFEDDGED